MIEHQLNNGKRIRFHNEAGLYDVNRFQSLLLADGVYSEATDYCVTHQMSFDQLRVHELCCGGGPVAVGMKAYGAGHVGASDINPRAVEACRSNASANQLALDSLAQVDVLDVDSAIEPVDLLACNAPCGRTDQVPTGISDDIEQAVDGGERGVEITSAVIRRAKQWLRPQGRLVFVLTSMMDFVAMQELLDQQFPQAWRVSINTPVAQPFLPLETERSQRLLAQCRERRLFVWDGGDGWLWRFSWIVAAFRDGAGFESELPLVSRHYDIVSAGYKTAQSHWGNHGAASAAGEWRTQ